MLKSTTSTIGVWSAVAMLIVGCALAIAGFVVSPVGEIHDSVLWIFAQILIYAGSVFGVGYYVDGKLKEYENYGKGNKKL